MEEVWKDIEGYEGLYQISNLGRVKSLKMWNNNKHIKNYIAREKILKPKDNRSGYYVVVLSKRNCKRTYPKIHRLVAQAFIENPNNYPVINHKNGIKTDNRVENLEWCTHSHNTREAMRLGLVKSPSTIKYWKNKFGKEHTTSKKVYQIDKSTNEIVNQYYGVLEASRITGFNSNGIYGATSGHTKSYKGYYWKYEEEYQKCETA